ncbi:MAG TPA: glycosyltransferase family 4 protein [Actinomycetota bacterium]|nr:glycosyltransferase family 4 protein [Actinomycetota bacterium]
MTRMDVSLITLGDPGRLTGGYLYHRRMAEAAASHGARMGFESVPEWPWPAAWLRAGAVLARAARADVVVLDSIAAAAVAPALALGVDRPVVAMLHQPPGGIDHNALRTRAQAGLDRSAYRRCTSLLAASDSLAAELAAQGFTDVEVVAPGRDPAPPQPPAEGMRAGREIAVVSVGNWVPRKGLLELLEALGALDEGRATLHLVGDTEADRAYARRVRARIARPDVASRVVVHGPVPRERIAALLAGADVFALASYVEPYGTVLGEALAAGLPIVGWRAGNLAYLARHERDALMAAPGDVAGLAGHLERLARDPGLRGAMAESARRTGAALPTWADAARRFFAALARVVGRAPERGAGQ